MNQKEKTVRQVVLEALQKVVIDETFSCRGVIDEACRVFSLKEPGKKNPQLEQEILAQFHNLYRNGMITWQRGFDRPGFPDKFFLSELGNQALNNLSRDPANPEGYMNYLAEKAQISEIAYAYVEESLKTFATQCHRATAVMIGAATERILLDLRDELVEVLDNVGKEPLQVKRNRLDDWKVKTVLDATVDEIGAALEKGIKDEPSKKREWKTLKEHLDARVHGFAQHIRHCRNESGHPASLEPVTTEDVHAALLMFPSLAELVETLRSWVCDNYESVLTS